MSDSREAYTTGAQRQSYATPELIRHGSLDELTHGAGTKETEKSSTPN
jgi:hypothetical protein